VSGLIERVTAWAKQTLPARVAIRFFAIDGLDRTFTLAAHAFMAIFPLLIVVSTALSRATGRSVADQIVGRLQLTGDSADAVHSVFTSTGRASSTLGAIGILLLLWSGLGFVRTLQRMYASIWEVPVLGIRGTQRGVQWIVLLVIYVTISTLLRSVSHTHPSLRWPLVVPILVITFGFWLLSTYTLVGWAIGWRRLLPGTFVATIGLAAVNVGSTFYMPHMIDVYDRRYGAVGITIAIIAWLAAVCFVVLAAAVIGAELAGVPPAPPRQTRIRALLDQFDQPSDAEPEASPEQPPDS
jgi:membrane protein